MPTCGDGPSGDQACQLKYVGASSGGLSLCQCLGMRCGGAMRLWAWAGPRSPWHRLLEWSGKWEQSVNLGNQGIRSGASVSPPVEWVWEWMPCLARALELGHSDSDLALEGTQLGREATVGSCGRRWEGCSCWRRREGLSLQDPVGSSVPQTTWWHGCRKARAQQGRRVTG